MLKDSISSASDNNEPGNLEDSYANLLKDADKLKLMLLAWNYQNSAAVRNGTTGPDLATMSNLWEQYQSALGINQVNKSETAGSPVSDLLLHEIVVLQKAIKMSKLVLTL